MDDLILPAGLGAPQRVVRIPGVGFGRSVVQCLQDSPKHWVMALRTLAGQLILMPLLFAVVAGAFFALAVKGVLDGGRP